MSAHSAAAQAVPKPLSAIFPLGDHADVLVMLPERLAAVKALE
jgi:hypothetical protein